MVATEGDPLVQVPPVVELLRVVVSPMQTEGEPAIAVNTGSAFTVRDCCAVLVPLHPPVIVYTMLQEPAATAVTSPVDEFTVATDVLLLLHAPVPPLKTTVFAVYCAVAPAHNGEVPVTDATLALGVTVSTAGILDPDVQPAVVELHEIITWPSPDFEP